MKRLAGLLGAALVAGCSKQDGQSSPPPEALTPPQGPVAPAAPQPPDAPKPLSEPKGAIDPTSVEAAGQVVQQFGGLLEQKRTEDAAKLWSDRGAAMAFAAKVAPGTHLEIGKLGAMEGAAGSIYTTVPVIFYAHGQRRPASIILRRANEVPGSTAEQRRWHIERIDLR